MLFFKLEAGISTLSSKTEFAFLILVSISAIVSLHTCNYLPSITSWPFLHQEVYPLRPSFSDIPCKFQILCKRNVAFHKPYIYCIVESYIFWVFSTFPPLLFLPFFPS